MDTGTNLGTDTAAEASTISTTRSSKQRPQGLLLILLNNVLMAVSVEFHREFRRIAHRRRRATLDPTDTMMTTTAIISPLLIIVVPGTPIITALLPHPARLITPTRLPHPHPQALRHPLRHHERDFSVTTEITPTTAPPMRIHSPATGLLLGRLLHQAGVRT